MLQREHSAILSTFTKLPFVIKISALSIFEWPFYTGFTVFCLSRRSKVLGGGYQWNYPVMSSGNAGLWEDNSDGKSCSGSFKGIQGSHRLEKYLKIQDCLEKFLKITYALKST